MKRFRQIAEHVLDALSKQGAQDAQCHIVRKQENEVNVESGAFSLLRTFSVDTLQIKAISDKRAGFAKASGLDDSSVELAIEQCVTQMRLAKPDEHEGIAEEAVSRVFEKGQLEPDVDEMLRCVAEHIEKTVRKDPDSPLDEYIFSHVRKDETFLNTNGVDLCSRNGFYRAGGRSGNLFLPDLRTSLTEFGEVENPFDERIRKEKVEPLGGKFEGSILFAPRFVRLYWWLSHLVLFNESATAGLDGHEKHRWADKFDELVASPIFSMSNRPLDERVSGGSPFTSEGYLSSNIDIIEDGVLKNLFLSGKAARALGRTPNASPVDHDSDSPMPINIFIKPGEQSVRDIVKGIDKGLLVFSMPGSIPHNPEGDFAGIIRGGLLIENGAVTRPVSEIMVVGNYFDMQKNIRGISKECRFSGGDMTPWIAYDGVTVQ